MASSKKERTSESSKRRKPEAPSEAESFRPVSEETTPPSPSQAQGVVHEREGETVATALETEAPLAGDQEEPSGPAPEQPVPADQLVSPGRQIVERLLQEPKFRRRVVRRLVKNLF